MNVSIIVIGDEILLGQVTDSNSGMLSRMISPEGFNVTHVATVGDNGADIKEAVTTALHWSDIVLTTGGLGPTRDDITKNVLTEIFGGELKLDNETLRNVSDIVERRGFRLNELTAAQAIVPTSCNVIQNQVGTAPLMWFERDRKVLVAMPGVPFETQHMMHCEILPRLIRHFGGGTRIAHRSVIATAITESDLAERLASWESQLPDGYHLAYLPRPGLVRLRIDGPSGEKIDRLHRQLTRLVAGNLLADRDISPAEQLLKELVDRKLTVATAESCTGGNIAHELTAIAGSSAAFVGSIVAYSNDVKQRLLHVKSDSLAQYGAVSETVVGEMANGVLLVTGADVAIATSGIAGPSGAVEGKPVGTVCIGVAMAGRLITTTYHFPGNRARVIDRSTLEAIIMAIRLVTNKINDTQP